MKKGDKTADVHPEEVENYQKGGYELVKGKSDAGKKSESKDEMTAEDLAANHKRKELEKMAKEKGLDGNTYTNKQELAEAILNA